MNFINLSVNCITLPLPPASPPLGTTTYPSVSTTPPNGTSTPTPGDCPYCLNGGAFIGGYCRCRPGYTGVYCQEATYQPPGTYMMDHRFACMGDVWAVLPLLSVLPLSLPPLSFFLSLFPLLTLSLLSIPSLSSSVSVTPSCAHCLTDFISPCGECYNGICDYASQECVCAPLTEGERCDSSTSESCSCDNSLRTA